MELFTYLVCIIDKKYPGTASVSHHRDTILIKRGDAMLAVGYSVKPGVISFRSMMNNLYEIKIADPDFNEKLWGIIELFMPLRCPNRSDGSTKT